MKIKKNVGNLILAVSTIFTLGGVASMFGISAEEMPESMKNKR